jgi:small-conductance mechanosensitive channel
MHEFAETLTRILEHRVFGNPVSEILAALLYVLIGLAIVRLFQVYIIKRLRKLFEATATTWDDLLVAVLERDLVPALYVLIVYLGLRDFALKPALKVGLHGIVTVIVTLLLVRVAMDVVRHSIRSYWQRQGRDHSAAREKNLNGIITMANIVVWVLAFILLLDNLGIKVSAFVAGLGITGIAVALAAQAILGDLFSYFVIFFDQPFEVGHVIKVDSYQGEVEHIGLKTTRLRSGDGEQIIVSNKFLTDSRVQNFKRMHRRRVVFQIEVEHATPPETLRGLPGLIKAQFARFQDVTFERSHFKQFTDAGYRFESAYVVETPDFNRYMDIQHEANLGLREEMAKAGIRLATPARQIHVRADGEADFLSPGPEGSGKPEGKSGGPA